MNSTSLLCLLTSGTHSWLIKHNSRHSRLWFHLVVVENIMAWSARAGLAAIHSINALKWHEQRVNLEQLAGVKTPGAHWPCWTAVCTWTTSAASDGFSRLTSKGSFPITSSSDHLVTFAKKLNESVFVLEYIKAPGGQGMGTFMHESRKYLSCVCVCITQVMLNDQNMLQHNSSYSLFLLGKQSWTKHCWTQNPPRHGVTLCWSPRAASASNDYSDIFWQGIVGQVHKCVLTNGEEFRWEEKLKCSILCGGPGHAGCSELELADSGDYIFSILGRSEYQFDGVLIHRRLLWVRMMHGCPVVMKMLLGCKRSWSVVMEPKLRPYMQPAHCRYHIQLRLWDQSKSVQIIYMGGLRRLFLSAALGTFTSVLRCILGYPGVARRNWQAAAELCVRF